MDRKKEAAALVDKYLAGACTDAEKALVERYYLKEFLEDNIQGLRDDPAGLKAELWQKILAETRPQPVRKLWPRIAAAASVLLAISLGSYVLLHKKPALQNAQMQSHDINPGHNQETLTLANGRKVVIKAGTTGTLAQQGHTRIAINTSNAVTYTAQDAADEPVQYNTLSTAIGEQSPSPLVLSDGTRIWLNAASSVTYPTRFSGTERKVTVTGEAYFEVAHNAKMPFKVVAAGQTINDIGTAFDVNAYSDEPVVKTTLVSGKVSIVTSAQSVLLKPGQAASTLPGNGRIEVAEADVDAVTGWQGGHFIFEGDDLASIMRQLSRWYNIDVSYQNDRLTQLQFGGIVSRNHKISSVLTLMESTGKIHFQIDGRRVMVIAGKK